MARRRSPRSLKVGKLPNASWALVPCGSDGLTKHSMTGAETVMASRCRPSAGSRVSVSTPSRMVSPMRSVSTAAGMRPEVTMPMEPELPPETSSGRPSCFSLRAASSASRPRLSSSGTMAP